MNILQIIAECLEEHPDVICNAIKEWLIDNEYDGFCGPDCGCPIDDLFACGRPNRQCCAGYKYPDGSIWSTKPTIEKDGELNK